MMHIAIEIMCLLIEAADEGIELKLVGNKLKVRAGGGIDPDLRRRLKQSETPIVKRLKHDAANPDGFGDFLEECCVFCATGAMGVPMTELAERYAQWVQSNGRQMSSLLSLDMRLRTLGCEQTFFQSERWWEHVALWQFGYVLRDVPRQPERPQQPKKRDYDPKASVEA